MIAFNEKALATLMTRERLNQRQLARSMQINTAYLSRVLAGKQQPGGQFLKGLMLAFPHVRMEYFFH